MEDMKLLRILTGGFFILFSWSSFAQVVVNEYSVSNLSDYKDQFNKYEDWIELYNTSDATIDLGGYFLSDKPASPQKWDFPQGTNIGPKDFLVIYASGRDTVINGEIHTSFKLSQTKSTPESIVFSQPNGELISEIPLAITQNHHSRGRISDGGTDWGIFQSPTLGASNSTATAYSDYAAKPTIDRTAGFYPNPLKIFITSPNPNATIHYTLDGSEPKLSSPVFSDSIAINQTTIVKAKAYSSNPSLLPSFNDFNTYFINEDHSLRVISVASEELEFLLNGNKSYRPIGSFELFDLNKKRVSKGFGEFNSHGQDSWVHDQRSIDYIARDEMGYDGKVHHQLYDNSARVDFQRVILRAAGDDNYPGYDTSAHVRDIFVETLADQGGLHLDVRKGARAILYVNGKYWGVYSTREKVDDPDYTKFYYGQSKYDLDFIMTWGDTWVEYGNPTSYTNWQELYQFITTNDMSIDSNYQKVTAQYNVKSLVDYVLVNSFVVCTDWLNWNVGWWRGKNPDGSHKKWGYILWDEDATFGHYENYTNVPSTEPDASPCYPEELDNPYSDPEGHITILKSLRANPEFDQYYISRYIDLANSTFSCDNMLHLLDSMVQDIRPEMPRHISRFGGNMPEWESNVTKLRNFIIARCQAIPPGLNDCYTLSGPHHVMFDVSPAGSGHISVNSLDIDDFPWSGDYFKGVDILLKGTPNSTGFVFDYWELKNHAVSPSDSLPSVTLNLLGTDTIIAHFSTPITEDSLVINEINYNSAPDFDSEDWVEFYNPQDYSLDISNWVFKDEKDAHEFVFPQGTAIQAHDYLVLCRDTAAFASLYPNVTNRIGNFDFGLSKGGELIRLFNAQGAVVDTVLYDDKSPWPTEPDGHGPTLELLNPTYDNALAASWKDWPDHGTPGAINHGLVATSFLAENDFSYQVVPNPFSEQAVLSITKNGERLSGHLKIIDLLGRPVQQIDVPNAQNINLDGSILTGGTYFFTFYDDKHRVFSGRFLVVE